MSDESDSLKHRLSGREVAPGALDGQASCAEVLDQTFLAYNAGRLREAAHLLAERMLAGEGLLGLSLSGALTPAGLGRSCLVPLLRGGYVDWIVATGANLYHDLHHGLGMELYRGSPHVDDVALRQEGIVRIYDILFDYRVLLDTDAFVREVMQAPEFQRPMGSDEFHYRLGRYVHERARRLGTSDASLLAVAYECGVPVFTSSPGDSSIGMNAAALGLRGSAFAFDVLRDVNQTAAIVYAAKSAGQSSSVWILGGGSPKNFLLQTEPHIQEVLGIDERGHDYFLQCTDARPDTGGLSGATPSEAVSWGKINPERLPDCVVAYVDATVALPLLTAYVLQRVPPRPLKRLYDRRDELLEDLRRRYLEVQTRSAR